MAAAATTTTTISINRDAARIGIFNNSKRIHLPRSKKKGLLLFYWLFFSSYGHFSLGALFAFYCHYYYDFSVFVFHSKLSIQSNGNSLENATNQPTTTTTSQLITSNFRRVWFDHFSFNFFHFLLILLCFFTLKIWILLFKNARLPFETRQRKIV